MKTKRYLKLFTKLIREREIERKKGGGEFESSFVIRFRFLASEARPTQ